MWLQNGLFWNRAKEYGMIRFIGGLWRIVNEKSIKSFTTYAGALAYLSNGQSSEPAWEEMGMLYTSDDIQQQLYK
jgi:hypothetical protein